MDRARSLDRLCRGGDGGIDLEELDEVGHLEELDEIVFHAAEGEGTFGGCDVFIEGDEGGETGGADQVYFGKIEDEADREKHEGDVARERFRFLPHEENRC